jgi:hypothetical protein
MTTNTGQRGKRAGDKNAGKGKPENVGMVQAGKEREDKMART